MTRLTHSHAIQRLKTDSVVLRSARTSRGERGGGGVLHISSDGANLMGAKIKTPKIARASNKTLLPQEIPGRKVNPKTSHADISEP